MAIVPLLMIANNNLPVTSVKDLIAMEKPNRELITIVRIGSAAHLAVEMFLSMTAPT